METNRPVIVKRAPERMTAKGARAFFADLQPLLRSDRPQIVLDLSHVTHLDIAGVEVLLECVREAMRRDGDVKLAAPSDQAAVVLELTRSDRLFEVYQSSTDAVKSFSSFLPNTLRRPAWRAVDQIAA